jgi:hypothetical protein
MFSLMQKIETFIRLFQIIGEAHVRWMEAGTSNDNVLYIHLPFGPIDLLKAEEAGLKLRSLLKPDDTLHFYTALTAGQEKQQKGS